jgi:hypothetical protein
MNVQRSLRIDRQLSRQLESLSSTRWWFLLPAIGVLFVVLGDALFVSLVGLHVKDLSGLPSPTFGPLDAVAFGHELRGRILWGLVAIAFVGATLVAASAAWFTLQGNLAGCRTLVRRCVTLGVLSLAALGDIVLACTDPAVMDPEHSIQRRLMDRLPIDHSGTGLSGFRLGLDVTFATLIAIPTIVLLVSALCSIVWRASSADVASSAAPVSRGLRESRALLSCASLLLVCGTIKIFAGFYWAAELSYSPGDQDALVDVAAILASAGGGLYSMMLLACYIPTIAILLALARRAAIKAVGHDDEAPIEKWLKAAGLEQSLSAEWSAVLAVAGPLLSGLLAGPVAKFLH